MSASDTKNSSETNWDRVDSLNDETIDTSDIPPLTDADFKRASVRLPGELVEVTLRIEREVLAWFKSRGGEYEQQISDGLHLYVEQHKSDKP